MAGDELALTLGKLASVLFLVLLNGFFVAAEFALVKIRDTQLETLAVRGHRRARAARRIVRNLDAALSATQLGITIASLGLGWVGKPVFAALLGPVIAYLNVGPAQADWLAFAVGFTIITFLHIVLGELAPKSLAIQRPLATSLWVAQPLHWFYILFYPAIWVLNHAAFWLLRRCGLRPIAESESAHSEEEIRLILNQARSNGNVPALAREIALNAFSLRRRRIGEVMKMRSEIVAMNTRHTIDQCLALARQNNFEQYPLCAGGNVDEVIGLISRKALWEAQGVVRYAAELSADARGMMFMPEIAPLDELLRNFLKRGLSLSLVVDEFGTTVGLVTLNDVFRQLVDPLGDGFSQRRSELKRVGEQIWELSGSLPVRKLAQLTNRPVKSRAGASTLSGLIIRHLGRFPRVGDALIVSGLQLRVEEIAGTRITRVVLNRQLPDTAESLSQPDQTDSGGECFGFDPQSDVKRAA